MGGKVRVHELAKELGMPAKDLLALLSEHGEFVKTASSTLEGPVARRVREAHHGAGVSGGGRNEDTKSAAQSYSTNQPRRTNSVARAAPADPPQRLTPFQLVRVHQRFRRASASGHDRAAINRLYTTCAKEYGVAPSTLREAVAEDFRLNPTEYSSSRQPRRAGGLAERTASSKYSAPRTQTNIGRARPRSDMQLPEVDGADTESVVELVVNISSSLVDSDELRSRVRDFYPDSDGMGYLAWRYASLRRKAYADSASQTAHHDLAVMAQIVDRQTQLLDAIIRAHGPVFEQPTLGKRVLEAQFDALTNTDDIGRSAADELRHMRDRYAFLQVAVVLIIANPTCDQMLWEMVDRIRPPDPDKLVETSPALESAIARLKDCAGDIETMLTADEAWLVEFYAKARTELVDMRAGRYEFLRQFKDLVSSVKTARRYSSELPFVVLPHGEQLREFLEDLRSSRRYRGHDVDEQRVAVLEEIQNHFGVDRCEWHVGTASSNGFNNHYVVLTIKCANVVGQHAVAISPLAGEHATYVVRSDCTKANWMVVLAQSKPEARQKGARKFLFSGVDPYSVMREKVIDSLECPPHEFLR